PLRPYVGPVPARPLPPPAIPLPDAEDRAVRAAVDAHRAEIMACVERLPIAVEIRFAPGAGAAVSLRGPLAGRPEDACVRAVLDGRIDVRAARAGTVVHVVR